MEGSGYSRLVGGDKQGGEECEWVGITKGTWITTSNFICGKNSFIETGVSN